MTQVAEVLPFPNNTVNPSCKAEGGSSGGGSSSANRRHSINSRFLKQQLDTLNAEYTDAFGRSIPIGLYKEIRFDLYFGSTDWRYYLYAIREAAAAPRPSWLYARKIMKRLYEERPDPNELVAGACPDGKTMAMYAEEAFMSDD